MKSVVFYSFKGGVGRTQSMLNIAKYLTRECDKKVAILDFDIYAPGITYLAKFNGNKDNDYLLKFLIKSVNGEESSLYYEEIEKNLFLIPSFNTDIIKRYHEVLTDFSQYLYSIRKAAEERVNKVTTPADDLVKLIIESVKEISSEFDYIFLDARTGITEVSDILFSNFVDLKVIISSYNEQNLKGTNHIIELLSEQKGLPHNILRILSPKPKDKDESKYQEIFLDANLDKDIELKRKLNWNGTLEISYEEKVVDNDVDLWDLLNVDCNYKKEIITIANKIDDILSNKTKISEILSRVNN